MPIVPGAPSPHEPEFKRKHDDDPAQTVIDIVCGVVILAGMVGFVALIVLIVVNN